MRTPTHHATDVAASVARRHEFRLLVSGGGSAKGVGALVAPILDAATSAWTVQPLVPDADDSTYLIIGRSDVEVGSVEYARANTLAQRLFGFRESLIIAGRPGAFPPGPVQVPDAASPDLRTVLAR